MSARRVQIEEFLGPESAALAAAIDALARETGADVVLVRHLDTPDEVIVRTQASRMVPAGRARKKPRRVLLRLVEDPLPSGRGGSCVWRPARRGGA